MVTKAQLNATQLAAQVDAYLFGDSDDLPQVPVDFQMSAQVLQARMTSAIVLGYSMALNSLRALQRS
jgi:hypothetical protein